MKTPVQTVMGHTIPEPAMTGRAYALLALSVAPTVLLTGMSLNLLVQWLFGWCVGFWCLV